MPENLLYAGLFEDPYIVLSEREPRIACDTFKAAGFEAQKASLVLLKNRGKLICKADGRKKTVYVPMVYSQEMQFFFGGGVPASITVPFDGCDQVTLVTDTIRAGPTGTLSGIRHSPPNRFYRR